MESLNIEHNGQTYKLSQPITDTGLIVLKGDKVFGLSSLYFFDPELHKTFGFTTVNSVLKWWDENKDEIRNKNSTREYETISAEFSRYFYPFYIRQSMSLSQMKAELYGNLNTPSISVHARDSVSGQSFHLVDVLENSEEKTFRVSNLEFAAIYLSDSHTSCLPETKWNKVHNYTFKMNQDEFEFFRSVRKEQDYFFGLELELSTELSAKELQYIVENVEPKQEPFFIFKQDSTVTGRFHNNIELVTVPCSPRFLRKNFKIFFQKIEKLCKDKGKTVSDYFDTRTDLSNGIHIHVGRMDFSSNLHKNRYLTAWNQWDENVVKLFQEVSQRPGKYSENRWCKISGRYLNTKPSSKFGLKKFMRASSQKSIACRLKGPLGSDDRYSIINQENSATLETRIYQGIFDLTHLMRCISFNEAMLEFSENCTYQMFDENFVGSFHEFLQGKTKYKLITQITEKLVA